MSDEDLDSFGKFQREADDIKPIDMTGEPLLAKLGNLSNAGPVGRPAPPEEGGDISGLTNIPPPLEPEQKTKRLRDGTVVPDNLQDYVYDEDLNKMVKGDYFDLLKTVPSLKKIFIAVGWDNISMEAGVDVDLTCFLLGRDGQTREDSDFLFYNNDTAGDGMVRHLGDNRSGAGEGDNETVVVDLEGLHYDVARIVVVLTIYDQEMNGLHLGQVRNIFVRLVDEEDAKEIVRYLVDEKAVDHHNAVITLALVREGQRWFAEALEEPSKGGLQALAQSYGIIVQEATG